MLRAPKVKTHEHANSWEVELICSEEYCTGFQVSVTIISQGNWRMEITPLARMDNRVLQEYTDDNNSNNM
jgi:hypothetical protein